MSAEHCRRMLGSYWSIQINMAARKRVLLLFDMDGTLTPARQLVTSGMRDFLRSLQADDRVGLALVGGSDLPKILEQMGGSFEQVAGSFDYLFSQNGLVGFNGTQPLPTQSIVDKLGEEKLQTFINHCLRYLSDIKLPAKRGQFVEFRESMINVSPIGRSCSQAERNAFVAFDNEHKVRERMMADLREHFPVADYNLKFSIGGQISLDVFPIGWDKSYCLQFLTDNFDSIHFFGDKTQPGGNDHEIFADARTIGHTVTSPDDTIEQVKQVLESL